MRTLGTNLKAYVYLPALLAIAEPLGVIYKVVIFTNFWYI